MKTYTRQQKLIVLGGFLNMCVIMGIVCNCFSLTIVPITEYFGFSRGSYGLSQTLLLLFSALFALNNKKVYGRIGLIKAVRIGVIIEVVVFFAQSFATKVWMFYISYAILGFCMSMTTSMPAGLLINEWIDIKPNTMIGIAMMGSGIGGAIFNPLMNALINDLGWQNAYRIIALIMACFAVPSAFFMLRRNPDALAKERVSAESKTADGAAGIPKFQKRILLFALILALGNGISAAENFAINPHLRDLGYSSSFASMCSSISMATMAVGKILFGRVIDRRGTKAAAYLCFVSTIISLVSLAFFRAPLPLFVVLINLGLAFGCPIGTVAIVGFTKEAVGSENVPQFMGFMQCCNTLGSTVAPLLLGNAYDIFGSYSPLLLALAAVLLIATPFIAPIFRIPLKTEE